MYTAGMSQPPRLLIEQLYAQIDDRRSDEQMSYRALAHQLGIPSSVFARLAGGAPIGASDLEAICAWLEMPTEWFFDSPDKEAHARELARVISERMRLRGERVLARFGK